MSEVRSTTSGFAIEIFGALQELFRDTNHVAVRRFEGEGSIELISKLASSVMTLLERAGDAMARVLEHYESEGSDTFSFEWTENEFVPSQSPSLLASPRIAIADHAFIAVGELRQHRQRLMAMKPSMPEQEIISGCGSALRAIKKCLYAIEPLLCELENVEPMLPPRLATSLAVRRQYQKLWSFAATVGVIEDSTVRGALRGAGTRIAILAGTDVYDLLREDDRFRLRDLQTRVLDWLGTGTDPLVALRIWQDFALFVEMLRQINLREELAEHDRRVLGEAVATLRSERALVELPSVIRNLRAVIGVDDALDRVIQSEPSAKILLDEVGRVLAALRPQSSYVDEDVLRRNQA